MRRDGRGGRGGDRGSRNGWVPHALALALVVTGCSRPAETLPPVAIPSATPHPPVDLPADAGTHDTLTEWWYYTGHLRTTDGEREFGFEFTAFQVRREEQPTGYLGHFAISDVTKGRFSHQARAVPGVLQPGFDLNVDGWTLRGDGEGDVMEAAMRPGAGADPPYALRLKVVDRKPPALHHGGYIDIPGDLGGSYYYSRTRLAAVGEIREGDGPWVPVSGQAWMDHQWGNFVIAASGGWDWYSLQLDDESEYMLYVLRGPNGETSAVYGSEVRPEGVVVDLVPGDVEARATGSWASPHTGIRYPSGWELRLPSRDLLLRIEPKLLDQELYFPEGSGGPTYWEGAARVSGERSGRPIGGEGYVELVGYGPG